MLHYRRQYRAVHDIVCRMVTEDVGAQLRRGVVEACVLGLLDKRPRYGWELAQLLIDEGQIIAGMGTLYPVLTRLRKRRYVVTFDRLSPEGRTRRYYELTDAGTQCARRVPAPVGTVRPGRHRPPGPRERGEPRMTGTRTLSTTAKDYVRQVKHLLEGTDPETAEALTSRESRRNSTGSTTMRPKPGSQSSAPRRTSPPTCVKRPPATRTTPVGTRG